MARYRSRISGPLLDRIDMSIEVPRLPAHTLSRTTQSGAEESRVVRARVTECRRLQMARHNRPNNQLTGRDLEQYCRLGDETRALVERAMEQFRLSARAYHRILRLARTIADLAQSETIERNHLSEAIGYRRFDQRG